MSSLPRVRRPSSAFAKLCRYSALAFALAAGIAVPAVAQTPVGVVSLINPSAVLDRAADEREPQVGEDILLDDRLSTDDGGQMHLMMLDKSSFTIGPNSDVTIDRFVYDPETRSGEMAMSAVRGVMRFVGGDLSKNQPVEINTSIGTLGIRGGILLLNISEGGGITAVFGFGTSLTVSTGAGEESFESVNRAGFMVEVSPTGQISDPIPATPEVIDGILNDLEGQQGGQQDANGGGGTTIDQFTLNGEAVTINRIIDSENGPLADINGQLVALEDVIEDTLDDPVIQQQIAETTGGGADVVETILAQFRLRLFDWSSLDNDIINLTVTDGTTNRSENNVNLNTDFNANYDNTFQVGNIQVIIQSVDEGSFPNTVGLEIQSDYTSATASYSDATPDPSISGDTFNFSLRDSATDGPTSVTIEIQATNGAGS